MKGLEGLKAYKWSKYALPEGINNCVIFVYLKDDKIPSLKNLITALYGTEQKLDQQGINLKSAVERWLVSSENNFEININ